MISSLASPVQESQVRFRMTRKRRPKSIREYLENWLDWTGRVRPSAAMFFCAAAGLVIGLPTMFGEFLSGDDYKFAVHFRYLDDLKFENIRRLLTMVHVDLYQPLPMLSFQLNHAMAAEIPGAEPGISPIVFHLTNAILHAVNAALVYLLVSRIARDRRAGVLTGFMFAWHPLAVEPVAWISGRMILLGTTFSLMTLCFCAYRRANARGLWPLWAGLSWLCALASKIMPTVPIASAICDWHLRRRINRRAVVVLVALLLMAIAASVFAYSTTNRMGVFEATQAETSTSAVVKLLLAARAYLENYVVPVRLAGWTPPPEDVAFLSMPVAVALLELVGLVLLTRWAWRHNRTALLGIVLFAVLLSPFLAATLGRRLLVADRYMYLPMVGLHLALASVVLQLGTYLAEKKDAALASLALITVILFAWASLSIDQVAYWRDTVARAERVQSVYPDEPAAWANLSAAYAFQGRPDEALRAVEMARKQWPDNARLAAAAGSVFIDLGRYEEAETVLRIAAEKMPRHPRTLFQLGRSLEESGRHDEARAAFRKALDAAPGYTPAAIALARSLTDRGETSEAIALLENLVASQPEDRDARHELAMLLLQRRDWQAACEEFARLLADDPLDQRSMLHYAVALTMSERHEVALEVYDRLLAIEPSIQVARMNRAGLLARMGRYEAAEQNYRAILEDHPDNRDARIGLHMLLQRLDRFEELAPLWESNRAGQFDEAESDSWLAWSCALAGRHEEVAKITEDIPPDSPSHEFANWALAWHAVPGGDAEACLSRLDPPVVSAGVANSQREQARAVLAALADLPASTRESDFGYYLLARALLFEGNLPAAEVAAKRLREQTQDETWRRRTDALIAAIAEVQGRRPATSEADLE